MFDTSTIFLNTCQKNPHSIFYSLSSTSLFFHLDIVCLLALIIFNPNFFWQRSFYIGKPSFWCWTSWQWWQILNLGLHILNLGLKMIRTQWQTISRWKKKTRIEEREKRMRRGYFWQYYLKKVSHMLCVKNEHPHGTLTLKNNTVRWIS